MLLDVQSVADDTLEVNWSSTVTLGLLTMPLRGSTDLERVSTAMKWVDLSFHGQYFLQFAVETSSHE